MNAGGKPSEEELKMMEDIIKEGNEQQNVMLDENANNNMAEHQEEGVVNNEKGLFVANKEVPPTEEVPPNEEATGCEGGVNTFPSNQFFVFSKVQKKAAILAHPSFDKVVRVARCFIHMLDRTSPEIMTIHGVRLMKNHRKLEITEIFAGHENLELPVPVGDDITILKDAVEGFVQWPSQHIFIARSSPKEQVGNTKKAGKADSIDIPATSSTTSLKNQDEIVGPASTKLKSHSFPQVKDVRSLSSKPTYTGNVYMQQVRTLTMRALYQEADRRVASEKLILIPLEEDIFGKETEAVVSWEILTIWAGLLEIDIQHFYAWIKYLKTRVMTEYMIPNEQYGFMCPYMLSMHIPMIQYEDRIDYIARELAKNKKLVFVPYNERGRHWVAGC